MLSYRFRPSAIQCAASANKRSNRSNANPKTKTTPAVPYVPAAPNSFPVKRPHDRPLQTGIFIDADNINSKCVKKAVRMAKNTEWMHLGHVKAYKDWNKEPADSDAVQNLESEGIELIQVSRISKKNSTDIRMCIDIVKFLHTSDIDLYVLVTGDSDFKHVLVEIRNAGKLSMVCSCGDRQNKWLERYTNEYITVWND